MYSTGTKGTEDKSQGFNSRDEYKKSLLAQAKSGKLNRKTKRAVKSMQRKKVK